MDRATCRWPGESCARAPALIDDQHVQAACLERRCRPSQVGRASNPCGRFGPVAGYLVLDVGHRIGPTAVHSAIGVPEPIERVGQQHLEVTFGTRGARGAGGRTTGGPLEPVEERRIRAAPERHMDVVGIDERPV
jgi:hypothetical protein